MSRNRAWLWTSSARRCSDCCAAALPAYALLPIQHWQTQNGARVYFVETRDLPMLDVSVDFPAGSVFDTRAKSGLAALTANTLRLGAGGLADFGVGPNQEKMIALDRNCLSLRL